MSKGSAGPPASPACPAIGRGPSSLAALLTSALPALRAVGLDVHSTRIARLAITVPGETRRRLTFASTGTLLLRTRVGTCRSFAFLASLGFPIGFPAFTRPVVEARTALPPTVTLARLLL
jgi:hypothetical protein